MNGLIDDEYTLLRFRIGIKKLIALSDAACQVGSILALMIIIVIIFFQSKDAVADFLSILDSEAGHEDYSDHS